MKPLSLPKYLQLTNLSKPACDRGLYKAIKKHRVRSIVEIGMGSGERAKYLVQIAKKFAGDAPVRYTGIDLFEGRPDSQDELSLISVHRDMNKLEAKVQLVPGEPHQAMPRIANSHVRTDMIIISAGYDATSLERSWYYMPRMIHANSVIFVQGPTDFDKPYQLLNRLRVEQLADEFGLRRPIAA